MGDTGKNPLNTLTEKKVQELVLLAQNGDEDALEKIFREFQNLVKSRARSYFLLGAHTDDVIQEGMIGLFKAVRGYDPKRKIKFKTFAHTCIERQIISAVKSASRLKHEPLNTYISFNQASASRGDTPVTTEVDPESMFIQKENNLFVKLNLDKILTQLEKNVLEKYLEGKSYIEISNELAKSPKSVGNAISRVKKKLEFHLK